MTVSSILDKALYSTLRIETTLENGKQAVATAFIFEYRSEDNNYPFMVTARKPVVGATEGRITLLQAKDSRPLIGKGYTLDIEHFEKLWYTHPDERLNIAVTPFVPFVKHVEKAGTPVFFHALVQDLAESRHGYEQIGLADDLVSIGYVHDFWDRKTLLPIVRHGRVSTVATENYQGKARFLFDGKVMPGAEGGPVFQLNSTNPAGERVPFLAGMLVPATLQIDSKDSESESREMGMVIKIEAILDTISSYLREKGFI